MNSATDSTDFLIQASLEAVESAAVQGRRPFPHGDPMHKVTDNVGRTTQIKARRSATGIGASSNRSDLHCRGHRLSYREGLYPSLPQQPFWTW